MDDSSIAVRRFLPPTLLGPLYTGTRPTTLAGMTGTWIGLLLIGAFIWLWMGAMAARERAILIGQRLCREAGVQLLDQSVALRRLRLRRTAGGLTAARRYAFEVSMDGADRIGGHIDMLGDRLQSWSVPMRAMESASLPHPAAVSSRDYSCDS